MKNIVAIIIFILFPSAVYSDESETTKEIWKALIIDVFPPAFCSHETYYAACANISYDICTHMIAKATEVCFENYNSNIPGFMNKKDGEKWGGYIGDCVGKAYMNAAEKLGAKSDSSTCKTYRDWEKANSASKK